MKDIGIITLPMFFSLLVSIGTGLPPLPETIQPSLDDCVGLGLSRHLPFKKEIIKIYSIIFYITIANCIICNLYMNMDCLEQY